MTGILQQQQQLLQQQMKQGVAPQPTMENDNNNGRHQFEKLNPLNSMVN